MTEQIKITQLTPQDSNIGEPSRYIFPIVNLDTMTTKKLSLSNLLTYLEYLYRDPTTSGFFTLQCQGGLKVNGVSNSSIILGQTYTLTDITTKTIAENAITAANSVLSIAQSSYARANVAFYDANTAHNRANSAYDLADSAYNLADTANTVAKLAYDQVFTNTYTIAGTRANFIKKYEDDTMPYQLTLSTSGETITDKGLKFGTQGYLVSTPHVTAPDEDNASIQLLSDFGIGLGSSRVGSRYLQNTLWANVRTGNVNIAGHLYVGESKNIYRGSDGTTAFLYDGISGKTLANLNLIGNTDLTSGNLTLTKTAGNCEIDVKGNGAAQVKLSVIDGSGNLQNSVYLRKDSTAFWILADRDGDGSFENGSIGSNPPLMYFNIPLEQAGLFGRRIVAIHSIPGGQAPQVVGLSGDEYKVYDTAASSDERIKKITSPITNATEKLCNLRTVYGEFTTKELQESPYDNGERIFLIAQDVEKEFPGIVYDGQHTLENGEPIKMMYYERLIPALVASIKELKQEIEELKNK